MLVLSSMYILVALGFAFLFNMLGLVNFAHGAIYMIGGYLGYIFMTVLGINPWIGLLPTLLIMAAFGVFLEKYIFRPLIGDFNGIVMVCVSIIVILETTVNILAGARVQSMPPFVRGSVKIGSSFVTNERILTFAMGIVLLGVIIWFVNRTKWGMQMIAIGQNRVGAILQGINVHRISMIACVLGCCLATIAGCLMGSLIRLSPFMGDTMLVKVIVMVILAGAGSISGIFITGIILGTLDTIMPIFVGGAASDMITMAIVIVLLLIRPQGFFGHEA